MESPGSTLQPVLNRLSTFFLSETQIHQEGKIARMQKRIEERKVMWSRYSDIAQKSFSKLYTEYQEDKGKEEEVQADLIAYLFTENRMKFESSKGSHSYDEEKEKKQIEGVVRALNGHHLHMGTGAGKSTSVLPIASIVDGFTRGKGKVIVGSATGLLTDEIKHHIEEYIPLIQKLDVFKQTQVEVKRIESEGGGAHSEGKSMSLMKDIMFTGAVQPETSNRQFSDYWDNMLENTNPEKQKKYYRGDKKTHGVHIFVGEEKDLVFDWMAHKRDFEAECPRIYMDEAHVPFGKKTPYEKTAASEVLSPEAVADGISEWMVNYLIAQTLEYPPAGTSYIQHYKGHHCLSSEGIDAVAQIVPSDITKEGLDPVSHAFKRGVSILYKSIGLEAGKSEDKFFQETLSQLVRFVPSRDSEVIEGREYSPYREFMGAVGDRVARMLQQRDKLFTVGKNGKNTLRDAAIDELLADNKYEPSMQAAVLAVAEKFEPIERNIAYMTSTYESFIHANKDKVVGFSGTLYVPDPLKHRMKKGSFADFLETETGRSVDLLSTQEIKPFPLPNLFMGEDQKEHMFTTLINDLKSETAFDTGIKRPTLLVDNGGLKSAQDTYARFVKHFGESRVVLLPPKPPSSDVEDSKDFELKLNTYRKMLAEGEIDFLISSGSAALGVNFEKSDGSFPHMRTVTLGMPDSPEKMAQIIGRRRMMEGNTRNHLWYLTMADLEEPISYLKEQDPDKKHLKEIHIDLYRKSQLQMRSALEKARQNPQKTLSLIADLWHELKKARASDVEQSLLYDDFMGNTVIPRAEDYIKRKVAKELFAIDDAEFDAIYEGKLDNTQEQRDFERRKNYKLIELYAHTIGLPSTLYSDIKSNQITAPKTSGGSMNSVSSSSIPPTFSIINNTFIKPSSSLAGSASFDFEGYLDRWYESAKQGAAEYAERLHFSENIDFFTPENRMDIRFVRPIPLASDLAPQLIKESTPFTVGGRQYTIQIVALRGATGTPHNLQVIHDVENNTIFGMEDIHTGEVMHVDPANDGSSIESMSLMEPSESLKKQFNNIYSLRVKYKQS